MGRGERLDFFDRYLIISHHLQIDLAVDFTYALREVVGERVIVVDNQNHSGIEC